MSSLTQENPETKLSHENLLSEQDCFPQAGFSIGVTVFWVEKTHLPHAVCAAADYVSQGRLGVHIESPVPMGAAVWLVLGNGSGFRGIVHCCEAVAGGYQAEVRLLTR